MAGDGANLDVTVERLEYAPDRVDFERVLALLAEGDRDTRLRIADAIDGMPAAKAAALADAVPALVEMLSSDLDRNRRHVLGALETIAAVDPAAVRDVMDQLIEEMTEYNYWIASVATEAVAHVAATFPEEADAVEPLLAHENIRVQSRAIEVFRAVTEEGHPVDRNVLTACAEAISGHHTGREAAIQVLANAGWVAPDALEPAVDRLLSAAEGDDEAVRLAALAALRHLAGTDPDAVRSGIPLFLDLATSEDAAVSRAAATLLATLALQNPCGDVFGDAIDAGAYFDRSRRVQSVVAVSKGLPGRELLVRPFFADDSQYVRYPAYRACLPVEP